MTFREFVQQRNAQQISEGSGGFQRNQRQMRSYFRDIHKRLGLSPHETIHSTPTELENLGFTIAPQRLIVQRTGMPHNQALDIVKDYMSTHPQGAERAIELLNKQERHRDRRDQAVKQLKKDTLKKATELSNRIENTYDPDERERLTNHLDHLSSLLSNPQQLYRAIPRTNVKPSVPTNIIPQSPLLQRALQKNRERLLKRGS